MVKYHNGSAPSRKRASAPKTSRNAANSKTKTSVKPVTGWVLDAKNTDLSEIKTLAEAGYSFGGSSARNTDLSEGGTQAVAISQAVGKDVSSVADSDTLISLLSQLPTKTMNRDDLLVLGARLWNSREDSSKIEDTVVLGSATYRVLRQAGFTDEEIADNLRWMAKENTKGNNGTVGDVGLDLPDDRSAHVSLKVQSNTLHNAGPAQAMTEVGETNYDPYEVPKVKEHDEEAFQLAGGLLIEKIKSGAVTVQDKKDWNLEEVDEVETVVYREPARKKLMFAPLSAFASLDEWKMLSARQQKVLSYFITEHRSEFAELDDYVAACQNRQDAINNDVVARVSFPEESRRRFAARMLGLRNSSAFYVNKGRSEVFTGRIPTIEEFMDDSNSFVGEPVVSSHSDAVKIPIVNLQRNLATVLQVRTRLADGQFNYGNVKMTGEYQASKRDIEFFSALETYRKCSFGSITDVVFSLD